MAGCALHGVLDDPAAVARALDGWPLDQDALRTGVAARAAFVAANHGLVRTVAARYQQRGLPLDDLVQEGTIGLLRAVDLFDPTRVPLGSADAPERRSVRSLPDTCSSVR